MISLSAGHCLVIGFHVTVYFENGTFRNNTLPSIPQKTVYVNTYLFNNGLNILKFLSFNSSVNKQRKVCQDTALTPNADHHITHTKYAALPQTAVREKRAEFENHG
jgi:hypothetical protein